MKKVVIRECGDHMISCRYELDLRSTAPRDCTGCWSCWLKTPGRCIHKDLDAFYRVYLDADKVIIFTRISQGFVSGRLKTLFDRMIPLFLPYITYQSGESMHLPRYDRYPDIAVYYQGSFPSAQDRQLYEDYIHRVAYQFHSKCEAVKPIAEFSPEEAQG